MSPEELRSKIQQVLDRIEKTPELKERIIGLIKGFAERHTTTACIRTILFDQAIRPVFSSNNTDHTVVLDSIFCAYYSEAAGVPWLDGYLTDFKKASIDRDWRRSFAEACYGDLPSAFVNYSSQIPAPVATPTKPENWPQPTKGIEMNQAPVAPAIQQVTRVFGVDSDQVTDDQIFAHINRLEGEIEALDKTKNKPEALNQRITDKKAEVQALVEFCNKRTAAEAAEKAA